MNLYFDTLDRHKPITALLVSILVTMFLGMASYPVALAQTTSVLVPAEDAMSGVFDSTASIDAAATPSDSGQALGNLEFDNHALYFEPNEGQTDASVRFLSRGMGGMLFFKPDEIVLALPIGSEDEVPSEIPSEELPSDPPSEPPGEPSDELPPIERIALRFVGANSNPEITGAGELPGVVSYFMGNEESEWITNLSTYAGVSYSDLYSGISLHYDGNGGTLKGTYVVAPGTDPNQIGWRYEDVNRVTIDRETGDLLITFANGEAQIVEQAPVAWQDIGQERVEVEIAYLIDENGDIGFAIGDYDSELPLIIDPTLVYSTYLGGGSLDVGRSIAVDNAGNAYVTGNTYSVDFAVTTSNPSCGSSDVFVSKFNAGGNMVWSTYVCGSSHDIGYDIAFNNNNNRVYITGATWSNNFPGIFGGGGGAGDAFVFWIHDLSFAFGSLLIDGSSTDQGFGLAIDSSDDVYVVGGTWSGDLRQVTTSPITPLSAANNGSSDMFIVKLDASLIPQYGTYLGGTSYDCIYYKGCHVAVDDTNGVYVTGSTRSSDFPILNPLPSFTFDPPVDIYVSKLEWSAGLNMVYSTPLGGSGFELSGGIAVDSQDNAIVVGTTYSNDFPTTAFALQSMNNGISDAFAAKVGWTGMSPMLLYSTYLGGDSIDAAYDVAVDSYDDNAYITGYTRSPAPSFPTVNVGTWSGGGSLTGLADAFVVGLTSNGANFIYSTYLGGPGYDIGLGIAADEECDAYLTGYTPSNNFPTQSPWDGTYNGSLDAFVTKIGNGCPPKIDPDVNNLVLNEGDVFSETITVTIPGQPCVLDIYFLADTTGSMGSELSAVKSGANQILDDLKNDLPNCDIAYGVGDYKDFQRPTQYDPYAFQHALSVTPDNTPANRALITGAINSWTHNGGIDGPEGQLFALRQVAIDSAIGWRSTATKKMAVWFGDYLGHEPVCSTIHNTAPLNDIYRADTASALNGADIAVIALDLGNLNGNGSGFDYGSSCPQFFPNSGQAAYIVNNAAPGGAYQSGVSSSTLVNAIVNQITTASTINNVSLISKGVTAQFVASITPAGGYGPLDPTQDHTLLFDVVFEGTVPCTDTEQVFTGTLNVMVDGVVVTSKTVTITVPPCTCTPPPDNMVAWWHLDEMTGTLSADIAMYPNNGTHINNPTPVTGKVAGALSFNGVDQYVEVPDHSEINFGAAIMNTDAGDFSIDAWIKTSQTNGVQKIVDKRQESSGPVRGYVFFVANNGQLWLQLGDNTGFTNYASGPTVNVADGEWRHVAVTVNRDESDGIIWYVDGMESGTRSNPTGRMGDLTNDRPLRIARRSDAGGGFFNGGIDEVEIFDRVLAQNEIEAIYDADSAGKCKCVEPPDNMVAWWHADHSARDISGYNNHGTLHGATYASGKVLETFSFDGVDDYVEVPDHSEINFGAAIMNTDAGDFSIDAWIKTSQTNGVQKIVDKRQESSGPVQGYVFFVASNGQLWLQLGDNTGFTNYASGPTVNVADGEWRHVAVTVNRDESDGIIWYVDGMESGTRGNSMFRMGDLTNDKPLRIGRRSDAVGGFFNGGIDEVEIFDRVLAQNEIEAIYNADSSGKCKCYAPGFTYSTEEDFTNGLSEFSTPFFFNVNAGPSDASTSTVLPSGQLQLNPTPLSSFPFVWIAASSRGTIVRIDVDTGDVLGEYRTAPDGMGKSPSRTTVDQQGNVWVGNRNEYSSSGGQPKGSVTRVGLVIGGTRVDVSGTANPSGQYLAPPFDYSTCEDRHGATISDPPDGLIKTSIGLADIFDWSNAGSADTHGGVSTAEDECIRNYTRVTGTAVRSVAVDANNDVWVGGIGNREHEKLSGVTGFPIMGSQINYNCGGYGALVDKNGVLWSARSLLRYDPIINSGLCLGNSMGSYGLGIDPNTGHIWHSSLGGTNTLYEINPVTNLVVNSYLQPFSAQGVAVDANSHVWVAEIFGDEVAHYAPDPTNPGTHLLVGTVSGFASTTGLAVDGNGNIWGSEVSSSATRGAARIDPNMGAIGAGGYNIGAIDLTVGLGSGAGPYNYSDMTGMVAINNPPQGFWQVTEDGGEENARWCEVCWNLESTGVGSSQIKVEIRAANTLSELMSATWVDVDNCVDLTELNITGQYIEIRVTMIQVDPADPPILTDLTVKACCETPDLGDAPDSTNHFIETMTTYPSNVTANFPTVYDDPVGISGPKHWNNRDDAWLGARISSEDEADQGTDQDGVTNIEPPTNEADRDEYDDGVHLNNMELGDCGLSQFRYDVTVDPSAPLGSQDRYVNVWFDFNRDGDWDDSMDCQDTFVHEWAVQNQVINVGPGQHILSTPVFMGMNPPNIQRPMWMRITLSEQPAAGPEDGRGPVGGYKYGETEDYYLAGNEPVEEADLSIRKTHTDTFTIGQTASYIVMVKNNGPGSASGFTITDPLPINLAFVSASGAGWACSAAPATPPHTVNCAYSGAAIPSGGSTTVVITVEVGGYEDVEQVENCVQVSSVFDSDLSNNRSCDLTDIAWPIEPPDPTITKTHSVDVGVIGQPVTFTLTVANVGLGDTIGDLTMVNTMSPYITFVEAGGSGAGSAGIDDGWDCQQSTTNEVGCTNPLPLPAGKTSIVTLVASVNAEVPLSIRNCVAILSAVDVDTGNNQDCDTVPIGGEVGQIHGMKFHDLNGNGERDFDERGLEGWTISLTDANGNVFTTTTDSDGNYSFMLVAAGTYTVSEVQQSGWTQTFPTASDTHTVTLEAGEMVEGIDFGNATETVTPGDVNCNGTIGSVEALFILQYDIGKRDGSNECLSARQARTLYLPACDVNGDGICGSVDALLILRCDIGKTNVLCPDDPVLSSHIDKNRQGEFVQEEDAIDQVEPTLDLELPAIPLGGTFVAAVKTSGTNLGAITAFIDYDSTQFEVVECQVIESKEFGSGGCNISFGEDNVTRFNTVMPNGATGSFHLADVTFKHIGKTVDSSAFQIDASAFTDINGDDLDVTPDVYEGVSISLEKHWIYLPMIER